MILKFKVFIRTILRKLSQQHLYEKISLNYLYKKKIGHFLIDKVFQDKAIYIPSKSDYYVECFDYIKKFNNSLFLEFGVGDGETAKIISECFADKQIYGFDSFNGFKDEPPKNSFWESFQTKFKNRKIPILPKNYNLIEGYLEDTFEKFMSEKDSEKIENFVIHYDMDVYEPAKLILNFLRKSKKKSIVMFDEFYNYEDFEKHEWRAFYEEIICYNVPNKMLFYTDSSSNHFGHLSKFCFEIN
tara:strand:- start:5664 stop:6392 length:729 start_codon:yes stop_codon:yes gene_type:complete